jgi:hypothetical protein
MDPVPSDQEKSGPWARRQRGCQLGTIDPMRYDPGNVFRRTRNILPDPS